MRGTYTATYLSQLASGFAIRNSVGALDVGAAFDLIVGTSTGAIVACALAMSVPLPDVVNMYKVHGGSIFPRRLPQRLGLQFFVDLRKRGAALAAGNEALRAALTEYFGNMTLGDVYRMRRIALAITAVELSQHRSWIFKTPHLSNTSHRDDNYRLVDVCLATSAAPLYRSLAAIEHPDDGPSGHRVFADGGLWANNPVLVGLADALEMTDPGREIHIFCLGACPRPAGELVSKADIHRDLFGWKFGGSAAALSIDAQEFAYDNIARMFAKHLDRPCEIIRFPAGQIPAALIPYLDLDDTRPEAMDAVINQARTDADMANSRCGDLNSREGKLITLLFTSTPPFNKNLSINKTDQALTGA